eukprot:GGOE01011921.1.p3 GENE.GGOE01011921.1~~GGOE01011921.1.p3  ORF type:complete len:109 (-),score=2.77 GGOE01011921.1:433-759(-)
MADARERTLLSFVSAPRASGALLRSATLIPPPPPSPPPRPDPISADPKVASPALGQTSVLKQHPFGNGKAVAQSDAGSPMRMCVRACVCVCTCTRVCQPSHDGSLLPL